MATTGLVVFRRDLRISDNTTLYQACNEVKQVFCVFILDPRQTQPHKYFTANGFMFMLESLKELATLIPLAIVEGKQEDVIPLIVAEYKIDKVYMMSDYTPFARQRDENIRKAISCDYQFFEDNCLIPISDMKPYKKFTPFYNYVLATFDSKLKSPALVPDITKIAKFAPKCCRQVDLQLAMRAIRTLVAPQRQHGGRKNGEQLLKSAVASSKQYVDNRENLMGGSTRLSAFLKFGVIGRREAHRAMKNVDFTRELLWTDFYSMVTYYNPHIMGPTRKRNFRSPNIADTWISDYKDPILQRFLTGTTGIPIIDAAVNELFSTGYMHNRCRMIFANVFAYTFNFSWEIGEQFFATNLTDYDPSNNNGGWQWCAGTGVNYQMRAFNPYLQQKKFDPECLYIKKWLPKLSDKTVEYIRAIRADIGKWD